MLDCWIEPPCDDMDPDLIPCEHCGELLDPYNKGDRLYCHSCDEITDISYEEAC